MYLLDLLHNYLYNWLDIKFGIININNLYYHVNSTIGAREHILLLYIATMINELWISVHMPALMSACFLSMQIQLMSRCLLVDLLLLMKLTMSH